MTAPPRIGPRIWAALDVGTNTVRMLAAEAVGNDLRRVDRARAITRLGQGVDATGRLHPDAVVRTLDAIVEFTQRARDAGAEQIRIAGTSVLRDARDGDAFLAQVKERTGLDIEVLAGMEEGRISYLGATATLPPGRFVVCDIGGGSTELSTSDASVSLDVGSVRLTERFLHGDPPDAGEVEQARGFVRSLLDGVAIEIPQHTTLVGVAGTITTLASVVLHLDAYDSDVVHAATLSMSDVAAASERLLSMTVEEIASLGPVERGRADVIGGGSLVLRCVMEHWEFGEVVVSERDILDGLVLDLAQRLGRSR